MLHLLVKFHVLYFILAQALREIFYVEFYRTTVHASIGFIFFLNTQSYFIRTYIDLPLLRKYYICIKLLHRILQEVL